MKLFKYITKLTIEELESNIVVPCLDENGNHAILIKNAVEKSVSNKFVTDNLCIQIDSVLYLKNRIYFYHVISSLNNDIYALGQFNIIYDYIFKKISEPITGNELSALITSLEDYFRISPEPNLFSLQVGVFGELFTIKYFYEKGYEKILEKYHDNFYSKHDIEIDSCNRIEIKSTVSERRIHSFKHNQIYRTDINVFVASVMLEQSKEGISLYELFQEIILLYNNPDSIFALRKLMKKCNIGEENMGLRFSLNKAYEDFKLFSACDLPKLECSVPDGVTNIKYDIDCSNSNELDINSFIELIEKKHM